MILAKKFHRWLHGIAGDLKVKTLRIKVIGDLDVGRAEDGWRTRLDQRQGNPAEN